MLGEMHQFAREDLTNPVTMCLSKGLGSMAPICYINVVMKILRCLLAAFLLATFGGGASLAANSSGMANVPTVAAISQPVSIGSNDCDGNRTPLTTTICSVIGTCMQAVDSVEFKQSDRLDFIVYPMVAEHIAGFTGSLEPFPPKSLLLA